jgi:hypothetical protein
MTINNKYIYSGNNPIINIDPDGRFFVTGLIVASIIGVLTASSNGGNFLEGALVGGLAFTAGFFAEPEAATFFGLEGAAVFAKSAFAGGLAGGVVGGLGHNMLGLKNFGEGFAIGFGLGVSGGAAGYHANYNLFNPTSQVAYRSLAGACAVGVSLVIGYFFFTKFVIPEVEIVTSPAREYFNKINDYLNSSEEKVLYTPEKSSQSGGQCYA